MKDLKKVPTLRFKDFKGEWNIKKLGKISDRVTRKNSELVSDIPLTISAQHGLIDQRDYFDKQIASRDISGYFLIKKGEFAYNKSYSNGYPLGAIKRLEKYKNGVLSTLYIVFKPNKDKIDSNFLAAYYSSSYWHKEVSMYAAEGARNHGLLNISPTDFFKTQIKFPEDIKEQTKIGEFFQKLDRAIELQQQKVEQSERYKKAMLQKMFPQKGETEPQLRFEGFSGEWEETKLGEIVEISSGITGDSTLSSGNYRITRIETIAFEKVNLEKVGFIDEKPDPKFLLNKRDILYSNINSLSQIGKTAIFYSDEEVYHGINLLRFSVKPETSPLFLFFYLKTESSRKWAMSHANQAVNQASINQSTLAKQVLLKPTLEEQTKIGEFFQVLDERIEVETKKLNHYESLKKAMLQRMFV